MSQFYALVYLALPGFFLPAGGHFKVTFGVQSFSVLNTWPSHLRCLCVISLVMLQPSGFLYRWWLFGQKQIFGQGAYEVFVSWVEELQDHLYLDLLDVKTE